MERGSVEAGRCPGNKHVVLVVREEQRSLLELEMASEKGKEVGRDLNAVWQIGQTAEYIADGYFGARSGLRLYAKFFFCSAGTDWSGTAF
jgi:hypothetical protein